MEKITKELADTEIKSWLDKKKVFESVRDQNKDQIETLIEAMCEGYLSLDSSSFEFKHKLMFPISNDAGEETVTELVYKPRLNDRMLRPYLKGVKADDADGRLLAYVSALTGQVANVLRALDTADKKISMAIAVFFL